MKKIAILLIGLLPFAAVAQKEIKPSIANAEKALRAGKFDEAKAIIDVTTASQEFMVDKKGPILEIGSRLAIQQVNYDFSKFVSRGGIYLDKTE